METMSEPRATDIARVRRRDRAVEDEAWIRAFLHRAPMCFLATVSDGQPFINPNLFYFDEAGHRVYLHTGLRGRTRANIEGDGRVCLTVAEMGRLLPGEVLADYSTEYASVVIFGRAKVVGDPAEVRYALQHQIDKYFPHLRPERDYEPFTDRESARADVFRVEIERWSAKLHQEPADHPGAFWHPEALFKRDAG